MDHHQSSATSPPPSPPPPTMAKKLLHIFKVMYYMIKKGIISKRKLMMDLNLLFKRGKIAGKAIRNLIASSSSFSHHHHAHVHYPDYPNLSLYNPREVEFSCSTTPSYSYGVHKRKNRKNNGNSCGYDYEAAIAKAFEMLNNAGGGNGGEVSDGEFSVAPSPMILAGFGKSPNPRVVRQLRITDSPFPIKEDELVADGKVDKEAEEFIKRFYEQLRLQQSSAVATPEYKNFR